jgi:predicted dehydrogenase
VELVAICDKYEEGLEKMKAENEGLNITYYTDFDEFIKHDMDGVVLANYANEHAPFAIKAMKAGFHVISEVLPCLTMKEAVELIETIEQTGKTYCYAENYCYMPGPYEMRRLYKSGVIGELDYCEGEYVHNCEDGWTSLTYGDPNHWRNLMHSTFTARTRSVRWCTFPDSARCGSAALSSSLTMPTSAWVASAAAVWRW